MISAVGIKVYSYLNITAVADFFMEIKPGEHGRVTFRGYLAGMPDVGRLQEEAVRITLQEDGDKREQVLFQGIIQSVHTFVENGVCQVILSALTSYQGQRRYIFEKTAELVGGVLVFGYKLGGKCRFGQKRYANRKMAGVSLRGTVEKRERESVYLKLDIDGADGKALHPYPWIPPTGNVMYCMPQEGTEAYLYFPEAEEESAYAVSEIHNSRCPVFADAQRRELVTEHGKKLQINSSKSLYR